LSPDQALGAAFAVDQAWSGSFSVSIARERCGSCHLVVKEDGRSTNEKAPTFARIANTPGMSSAALRSALNTSHSSMPNLIIKDEDADSIIAYILSLRDGQ
jgi:mono/diheme cytochrome c family protein